MPLKNNAIKCLIPFILNMGLQACGTDIEDQITSRSISIETPDKPGQKNIYANLVSAIDSAYDGDIINISEGVHLVNNPIIFRKPNLTLRGAGIENTEIRAKNPNQPVLVFAADGITIKSFTVDALVEKGPGKASFAVHIMEDVNQSKIVNTKILNAAATAILGSRVSDCLLDNNTIINAGDDAVRLRGSNLTVIDNIIIQYFDEALDLAAGANIFVANNYVSEGRIGIVVDDASNMVVINNVVENQISEGLVTGIDPKAIVAGNLVRNTGHLGYNLFSPYAVISNSTEGNGTGFQITDMDQGIISGNMIRESEQGFKFINNDIDNQQNNTTVGKDRPGKNIIFRDNCQHGKWDVFKITCPSKEMRKAVHIETTKNRISYETSRLYNFSKDVATNGKTDKDRYHAKHINALLEYYNPGFLDFTVDGTTMESNITADLHATLVNAGQEAIGLVRAPFLRFSRRQPDFNWYLLHDGKKVIHVTPMTGGPSVKFAPIEPL